jgi:predicted DNA-binding transcriptional regulator AlpA
MIPASDRVDPEPGDIAATVGKVGRRLRAIAPDEAAWWAGVVAYGPGHPALIGSAEVARAVGRSPATIRWWRWRGTFPLPVIVGGRLRHLRREVQVWTLTRRRPAASLTVASRVATPRARPGR